MDERPVDFANQIDFLGRAECQDHAISLETLVLAAFKTPLDSAVLIDERSP
jgi:hypothetical protein